MYFFIIKFWCIFFGKNNFIQKFSLFCHAILHQNSINLCIEPFDLVYDIDIISHHREDTSGFLICKNTPKRGVVLESILQQFLDNFINFFTISSFNFQIFFIFKMIQIFFCTKDINMRQKNLMLALRNCEKISNRVKFDDFFLQNYFSKLTYGSKISFRVCENTFFIQSSKKTLQ